MAILPVGIGAEEGGYQIERSLRFNSADSAYLSRTPASAGNRKTWTIALWFKRTAFGSLTKMFSAGAPSGAFTFFETVTDNTFKFGYFNGTTTAWSIQTTQVFRDPSAWMHMVLAVDTTQATNTNRIKLYINGSQVTALTATYPSQNTDTDFNNTVAHQIGNGVYNSTEPFNGYMADFYLIDGSALDPTSFGEYNSDTGVWQPKAYTGSYGTNGFYLDFADNSSTTALGYDAAGSNDWTPNNFSVTAGAGNDSLVDTPTNYGTDTGVGGEVRGNYCTLSPLNKSTSSQPAVLSEGNLRLNIPTGANSTPGSTAIATGTMLLSSGKWYFESKAVQVSGSAGGAGVGVTNAIGTFNFNGGNYNTASFSNQYKESVPADTVMIAYDADNNLFWKGINGTWDAGNPATGTGGTSYTGPVIPFAQAYNDTANRVDVYVNFGQRPFAYTAPSGFKALCTQNLPEPTVVDGGDYFETKIWTGDGTSSRAITGLGFQPGLVWGKVRSTTYGNVLYDAVRGANKRLVSNNTDAEDTISPNTNLISFDSDGFTVGSAGVLNESSQTYVGWAWKANGAGVSNTDGTITSTVSANTTAGFSIVKTTGTGSAGTIGHGLSVAPRFIFGRNYSDAGGSNWPVYHASVGANNIGWINLTNAFTTSAATAYWNDTAPTSSVFSVGTNSNTNQSGASHIFYCFAPISGYSAFGSYTGNGSADGPFVYLGFKPKYFMLKAAGGAYGWYILDTSRGTYNVVGPILEAQSSTAEYSAGIIDFVSNGIKLRNTGADINGSGATYIYMAFAENPFKVSLAR